MLGKKHLLIYFFIGNTFLIQLRLYLICETELRGLQRTMLSRCNTPEQNWMQHYGLGSEPESPGVSLVKPFIEWSLSRFGLWQKQRPIPLAPKNKHKVRPGTITDNIKWIGDGCSEGFQCASVQVRTPFCSQEPVKPPLRVWLAKVGVKVVVGRKRVSLERGRREGQKLLFDERNCCHIQEEVWVSGCTFLVGDSELFRALKPGNPFALYNRREIPGHKRGSPIRFSLIQARVRWIRERKIQH